MITRPSRLAPGAILTILCAAATAHAQTDPAAAQAAFDEAKQLMAHGDYAHACPKLEESLRLDPGPGTEFNLADCDEHAGKTATAWSHFISVADALRLSHDPARSAAAEARAKALEPRLARLAVKVADASKVAGLEVRRDAERVGSALWGSAVPVDPGEHSVSASAPGYARWEQSVTVANEGATVNVDVPKLQPATPAAAPPPATTVTAPPVAPPPAEPSPPPPASSSGMGGQKIGALVVGGAGVVGLVLGSVFAASASSSWSSSQSECASPTSCSNHAQAVTDHDSAAGSALASTISFVAGGALVATGVVLWLTAPRGHGSASGTGITVAPSVHAKGGSLSLQGVF